MLFMARKPEPPPKVSRITVPARCHAAVKVIFAEMQRQAVTYDELEFRSGVLKSTFKAWRTNNRPGLETVEAALGALGWAFLPVPSLSQLPPSIREGLQALAAEWGDVNPLLCELLANVCRVRVRHPDETDKPETSRTLQALRETVLRLEDQLSRSEEQVHRLEVQAKRRDGRAVFSSLAEKTAFYNWRHRNQRKKVEAHA